MSIINVKITNADGTSQIKPMDTNVHITEHFQLWELANLSSISSIKYEITPRQTKFMNMMEVIRNCLNEPMTCGSNYRTEEFNNRTKGADKKSRHLYAEAFDYNCKKITQSRLQYLKTVWQSLCKLEGEIGAINFYTNGCHFEIGSDKSYGNTKFVVRDYRNTKQDW